MMDANKEKTVQTKCVEMDMKGRSKMTNVGPGLHELRMAEDSSARFEVLKSCWRKYPFEMSNYIFCERADAVALFVEVLYTQALLDFGSVMDLVSGATEFEELLPILAESPKIEKVG